MEKVCSVDGCDSAVLATGLCIKHYNRLHRKGSTSDTRKNAAGPCSVHGCDKPCAAFGRCDTHYRREFKPRPKVDNGERACLQCGEPLASTRRRGSMYCTRKCKADARVASGQAAEATRRNYFRRLYSMTLDELAAQIDAQGGVCAICGTSEWGGRHNRPAVDHCHKTGRNRKLLCSDCNLGLGKFRDDPELLERAAAYLREHC